MAQPQLANVGRGLAFGGLGGALVCKRIVFYAGAREGARGQPATVAE